MSSWKGLAKQAPRFDGLDVPLLGVAADSPEQLTRMREELQLPYTMLSDPELITAELLGVPTSRRHPKARSYPKKAFLQPSLFVWRASGELLYQWRQTPKITNLFGASNRPSPEQMVAIVERSLR